MCDPGLRLLEQPVELVSPAEAIRLSRWSRNMTPSTVVQEEDRGLVLQSPALPLASGQASRSQAKCSSLTFSGLTLGGQCWGTGSNLEMTSAPNTIDLNVSMTFMVWLTQTNQLRYDLFYTFKRKGWICLYEKHSPSCKQVTPLVTRFLFICPHPVSLSEQ